MKCLQKDLNKIAVLLKNHLTKILLLDLDGTLTPIKKFPQDVNVPGKNKRLLYSLSKKQGLYLAIISGRKLKDLKEKVGLLNIIYAGNHGLEGDIYGKTYSFPIPEETKKEMSLVYENLMEIGSKFRGSFIENKGLTLSFHYRNTPSEEIPALKKSLKKIAVFYQRRGLISFVFGRKAFDVRPKGGRTKGGFVNLVIEKISEQIKTTPICICIGDDKTDEDAFLQLKKEITIKVGKNSNSYARYFVNDTEEVISFLNWLNKKL